MTTKCQRSAPGLRESMPTPSESIASSSSDITPTPTQGTELGLLITLPKELRELIYSYLFNAGSTTITRTSKALMLDTKESLTKHGFYRLKFDQRTGPHPLYRFHPPNPPLMGERVRNLEIRLSVGGGGDPFLSVRSMRGSELRSTIREYADMMHKRKICHVRVDVRYAQDMQDIPLMVLKAVQDFKYVTVEICQRVQDHIPRNQGPEEWTGRAAIYARISKNAVDEVEDWLESDIGEDRRSRFLVVRTFMSCLSDLL